MLEKVGMGIGRDRISERTREKHGSYQDPDLGCFWVSRGMGEIMALNDQWEEGGMGKI
jgi:hypothetical protein